nr:hypothetical protein [Tanacetum cinerariifolium]
MPEDIKVPLILERPFLFTAHAKIDVYKRKITLRVGEEKIVFKSVKLASSLIKRVYKLSLRERMELDLEARIMGETLVLNRLLDPFFEDYIELNDQNEPIEIRRNQGDDLMPTIKEDEVIEEFRIRDDEFDNGIDDYPSYYDYDKKIHIDCSHNLKFSCMIGFEFTHTNFFLLLYVNVMFLKFYNSIMKDKLVYKGNNIVGALMDIPIFVETFFIVMDFVVLENMDAYRDEGMGDIIVGKRLLREFRIKARRFDRTITLYKEDKSVTYQMVQSHPRFKCHTNKQCNKIPPLLKHAQPEDTNELFQKLIEDLKIIREELAEYINSPSWNYPTFYDDEEYSIQYKEYLEKPPDAITTVLPTEEPDEYEVASDDESECDVPIKDESSPAFTTFSNPLFVDNDDFTSSDDESLFDEDVPTDDFKLYSNPHFDDAKINSDNIDPDCFNAESDLIESLLNQDTLIDSSPKFDFLLKEFSGELAHINPILPKIKEADFDLEEEILLVENLLYDNSSSRPPEELNVEIANTIVESLSPSPILVEDSDSLMDEIDLFLATDDLVPPRIKSDDYDSEGDIHVLEELLVDDSIPFPENESPDFDHQDDPLFPRPPPEPPDVEFLFDLEPDSGEVISAVINNIDELDEDECFDPGGEINVFTNIKDDDYFPFIFVIRIFLPYLIYPGVSPLLLSAGSEDTIFDHGISV